MTFVPGAITFAAPRSSAALDAFGRLVVAQPSTIFDSKLLHDKLPLFWDEVITNASGNATSTHSIPNAAVTMYVENGDTIQRQTKVRWNYQPGKGQLIAMTGILGGAVANSIARIGSFDANDGLFFERNGSTYNVVKRKSAADTVVAQSAWNQDKFDGTGPSKVTLDFSTAQIFFIAYEWLGVGTVSFGFYVNGVPHFAHTISHLNTLSSVYMSTPNHPLRYEVSSTGGNATLVQICSTVISNSGRQPSGNNVTTSTGTANIDANVVGTIYSVLGIRLKASHLDCMARPINMSMLINTNDDYEWLLVLNPTVNGGLAWADIANSCMQKGTASPADPSTTTITANSWSTQIAGGYVRAGNNSGDAFHAIRSQIWLGSTIAGVADRLVLAVRPLAINADVYGTLTWEELQ